MKINMHSLMSAPENATLHIPTVRIQASQKVTNNPADTVTISDAGRHSASAGQATDSSKTDSASKLRNFIKQFDFHSISPRQMTAVFAEIVKQEKISSREEADRFSSFISIEMNTVVEMDPNKPIDMVAHFKRMLDVVEEAAISEPTGYAFAVEYRRQASQALDDVISFANSNRRHI